MRKVLNVGGGTKERPLPPQYQGWQHVLLDIDPRGHPDVLCDARKLAELPAAGYDAVYCSHNLEHYYGHEVPIVLAGFRHVLKAEGFAHIRVPDLAAVMRLVAEKDLDVDDELYSADAGPITVQDVLYGYGREIEESGNDFYAHKTGFTSKSLFARLKHAGFESVFVNTGALEIQSLAFKASPSPYAVELFGLPPLKTGKP